MKQVNIVKIERPEPSKSFKNLKSKTATSPLRFGENKENLPPKAAPRKNTDEYNYKVAEV